MILATGARELFLPFPGWTLPNVMGAGGLQALVKSGLPIEGKSVVVAGSGPLLLAVAALLKKKGAVVRAIAEQAPMSRLVRFGLGLWSEPGKLFQAIGLRQEIGGVRYRAGCWPVEAVGDEAAPLGQAHRRPVDLVGRLRLPGLRLRPGPEPGTADHPGLRDPERGDDRR